MKDYMPVRIEVPSFSMTCPLNMKHLLGKKFKNRIWTLSIWQLGRVLNMKYLLTHFSYKIKSILIFFFYGKKAGLSSPSNFCICIFEVIPCTAKLSLFLVYWKDLNLDSRHQQNTFPRLKSCIKLLYPKTTFLEGHFNMLKRWSGGCWVISTSLEPFSPLLTTPIEMLLLYSLFVICM